MKGLLALPWMTILACASPARAGAAGAWSAPTQTEWSLARARLAELRSTEPRSPYVEIVRVTMREPRTGKTLEGRGAVAVSPGRAMRMILLGPGGTTALDVWATRDRYRFAVPPLDVLRRGGPEGDEGAPIGFFRWWFLDPLEGRLLTGRAWPAREASRQGDASEATVFVLRDGAATVTLRTEREGGETRLWATRREGSAVDVLSWSGRSLSPAAGDRASYEQPRTGLRVEVGVELLSADPPEAQAFLDPDGPGGSP